MSLPFKSLDAATSTGPGASKDLESVFRIHTIAVVVTDSPTTFTVKLEGSHDEINWYTSGDAQPITESTASYVTHDLLSAVPETLQPQGGQQGKAGLWRYVRANLTVLTGGSSPTVTATIASA